MLEENGKLMRITRETLGYSYSQVEEATKVRELYLQLLESGDLAQMPGRIYAIGFADTYARFLGMDPAPILADVKAYYEVNSKQNNFEAYVSGKKVVQTMAEGGNYDPTTVPISCVRRLFPMARLVTLSARAASALAGGLSGFCWVV